MAKISGAGGTATFDTTEVLITGWSCDTAAETIDVTDSGDTTWQAHIPSGFSGLQRKCNHNGYFYRCRCAGSRSSEEILHISRYWNINSRNIGGYYG